jgi:hypothetical protein
MRVSPRLFLAAALPGALAVVYCRPAPEPAVVERPSEAARPFPEAVRLRAIAKWLVARDAAAGRRTLVEAAALFRELNRLPPAAATSEWFEDPPPPVPLDTEEERLCAHVLAHVHIALRGDPAAQAAAVARLAAEFREEVRRRGAIRLPDPSALTPVSEVLERARAWQADPEHNGAASPSRPVRAPSAGAIVPPLACVSARPMALPRLRRNRHHSKTIRQDASVIPPDAPDTH